MKTILDSIIDVKRIEVQDLKNQFSYNDFEASPFFEQPCRSLKEELSKSEFGIIAEFKRNLQVQG